MVYNLASTLNSGLFELFLSLIPIPQNKRSCCALNMTNGVLPQGFCFGFQSYPRSGERKIGIGNVKTP